VIQPGSEMVIYPECGGGLNLPPLFTPEIAWDIRSDRLAVSATSAYRVDVLLVAPDSEIPGAPVRVTMVRSLRRAIEPRDATRDLAIQELGEGFRINFGRGPCTIPPDRMVDGRGYASTIPWVRRIAVAPDGAVWIERRMIGRDSAGPIDVFDADGAYVGTLAAGSPFPIVFLRPDRIAYALTDEMDVDRLVVADVVKR
jgi:hypothetical protein